MREKCTGEKPHIMLTPSAYERGSAPLNLRIVVKQVVVMWLALAVDLNLP